MNQSVIARSPSLTVERGIAGADSRLIAGVDEAGRGPWAGPVTAAAVIFRTNKIPKGLNDSKCLSAKVRIELYDAIIENAWIGVGTIGVEEIDSINILQATMRAMTHAVSQLGRSPDTVLIDGNRCPTLAERTIPVVSGDRLCPSIAAASIVAKVTRDRFMEKLSEDFPVYGWHSNKGYGTRAHAEAIAAFGVTPHHRNSFSPVRAALAGNPIIDNRSDLTED
jgi:ribonuclease HII